MCTFRNYRWSYVLRGRATERMWAIIWMMYMIRYKRMGVMAQMRSRR